MKLREKSSSWSARKTSSSCHCARSDDASVASIVEVVVHAAFFIGLPHNSPQDYRTVIVQ